MARIAYFYREMSEYIEIDLRRLAERHVVSVVGTPSRWPRPLATWREVSSVDVVMSWFASWHSLAPAVCAKLQRKPFIVTVGGYDTACLPDIGYGHQRGGVRRWIARLVMRLATRIVSISEATTREVAEAYPRLSSITQIPLGLAPGRYASSETREAGLVVTTGGVNHNNLKRKGLEAFVRAAAHAPECRFVVIGAWMDDAIELLRAVATPNVHFTGRITHEDKVAWLSRAEVVVQASQHEAFGLSLAEGMLCGATPVVTRAGALPWVAGGTGVIIERQAPSPLAAGIRTARALGASAGQLARTRVLECFTEDRRAAALHELVELALSTASPGTSAPVPGADPATNDTPASQARAA